MFFTRKILRALNNRLLYEGRGFVREARYARKKIAKWRHKRPRAPLMERVVRDALIDTWNELHGFKEWSKVEVDLAVVAERIARGPQRKHSRKSQERPRWSWF